MLDWMEEGPGSCPGGLSDPSEIADAIRDLAVTERVGSGDRRWTTFLVKPPSGPMSS